MPQVETSIRPRLHALRPGPPRRRPGVYPTPVLRMVRVLIRDIELLLTQERTAPILEGIVPLRAGSDVLIAVPDVREVRAPLVTAMAVPHGDGEAGEAGGGACLECGGVGGGREFGLHADPVRSWGVGLKRESAAGNGDGVGRDGARRVDAEACEDSVGFGRVGAEVGGDGGGRAEDSERGEKEFDEHGWWLEVGVTREVGLTRQRVEVEQSR